MSLVNSRFFGMLLALVAASGCAVHYVSRGADLYADGYYIEAAEVFERTEARLDSASPDDRARYGLYRGATLLALGDQRGAERWLKYAETELNRENGALAGDERTLLRHAMKKLADRKPALPPPALGTAVATTRVEPRASGAVTEPTAGP